VLPLTGGAAAPASFVGVTDAAWRGRGTPDPQTRDDAVSRKQLEFEVGQLQETQLSLPTEIVI